MAQFPTRNFYQNNRLGGAKTAIVQLCRARFRSGQRDMPRTRHLSLFISPRCRFSLSFVSPILARDSTLFPKSRIFNDFRYLRETRDMISRNQDKFIRQQTQYRGRIPEALGQSIQNCFPWIKFYVAFTFSYHPVRVTLRKAAVTNDVKNQSGAPGAPQCLSEQADFRLSVARPSPCVL